MQAIRRASRAEFCGDREVVKLYKLRQVTLYCCAKIMASIM